MNGGLVVDSSALLAIVLGEPEAARLADALVEADPKVINALTLLEASIASERRGGVGARHRLDALISTLQLGVIAFDSELLSLAQDACRRFGKSRHAAALNLGDCVAYATARHLALPLLFVGKDFERTDIERACVRSGSRGRRDDCGSGPRGRPESPRLRRESDDSRPAPGPSPEWSRSS